MVYHGKPSKGCGNCRTRKIKCDEGRPACHQCTRTNRVCPGYRDEWTMMLRDESRSTARKHSSKSPSTASTASSASLRHRSPPGSAFLGQRYGSRPERHLLSSETTDSSISFEDTLFDFDSASSPDFLHVNHWSSPLSTLPDPILSREEAICFFLQSHAIPGNSSISEALNYSLATSGPLPSQRAIRSCIAAVASAMLARIRRDGVLQQTARQEYGSALTLVNEALSDGEEAMSNHTLGAVVLLSLYELVISRAPQGIDGWTNHIRGAAALLEHRGLGQLQSEAGVRLFLHLRYQIIISCLQRDVHVPDSLFEYNTALDRIPGVQNLAASKLILLIGKLSNLRADIHTQAIANPQHILAKASSIEADLIAWLASLPPEFTYTSHTFMSTDRAFQRSSYGLHPYSNDYHIYPDMWALNCWNHYRCARILVSEIMLSSLHKITKTLQTSSSEDLRIQVRTLRSTVRRLGTDITRSVPSILIISSTQTQTTTLPDQSYLGGLMLVWPLWIAGIIESISHPQRKWVIRCFEVIGNMRGLAQALAVMDILRVDPGMFYSVEKYGEAADGVFDCEERERGLVNEKDVLGFSIFHLPYFVLPEMREYRDMRASSG
ncbi:Zn(II)2Cys6 transcription factor [Aspergillus stella-maris]|uniref:Zn(II)2Cys6 transcription factor n=1 Tax=Aspergillus stella-maris TaxID=1810926 RepID=UPI003CCDA985